MLNCSHIREQFAYMLEDESFAEDGNLELLSVCFEADEPSIFGTVNEDWNKRELRWYMSQSLSVNDIPAPIPKIWKDVASKDGMINSNYGWAVFSKENGEQFNNAIKALKDSKYSRQASLIYNRPSMHTDAKKDGMKDFMCTYATQFIIRDNLLCHFVYMRSSDLVHGYKGDWAWQNFVHDLALYEVQKQYPEVQKGPMMWHAASLHVYPRHFELVRNHVHNL